MKDVEPSIRKCIFWGGDPKKDNLARQVKGCLYRSDDGQGGFRCGHPDQSSNACILDVVPARETGYGGVKIIG